MISEGFTGMGCDQACCYLAGLCGFMIPLTTVWNMSKWVVAYDYLVEDMGRDFAECIHLDKTKR